ncbi:MAG: PQQ-like beta-propeller repeat protein [Bacteroidales bacterium]|nr:PQQ-like beta-propeller repeat protein [Bacteroidales bacterium]
MFRLPLTLLLTGLVAGSAWADNWPQWRGPKNDGHSTEKNLPTEFGPDKNVLWKAPMPGPGASTPCIWGDKIFLTAQAGEDLVLFCINTEGKTLWTTKMGSGKATYRGDEGNLASASCSTDGRLVFAFVGSGELGAYDFDGKPVWQINTQEKYGPFKIQFGAHWTPVLYKDRLYVELFHRGAQLLIALDKNTGKEIWKVTRTSDSPQGVESPDVYASPFIWEGKSGSLLIAHGNDYCTAHKLDDGAEVWRVTELNPKDSYNRAWRAVSSPLVTPDLIVIPSCKRGVTVGLDPLKAQGTINPGNTAEVWRLPKGTPDVPSPIRVGNLIFLMGEKGDLTEMDAKTGEIIVNERITNERHRANPVLADDKLYLLGREGTCPVVQPAKPFEVLAKNKLPDTFTASPATADGRLYLRGWNFLWVIAKK